MCGITGFLSASSQNKESLEKTVNRMSQAIAHRGPDDMGTWVDAPAHVGLGHRRLSIIDLSNQGHQPMASPCGRYVMVFNGEIYNHAEIRRGLGNHLWRGHSDTETILALASEVGPINALERLVGMFAIAMWDRQDRKLLLARDRMGEKPLYYGHLGCGDFVFGSELHALRAHPRFDASVDRGALALYMRHAAVPGEHSIYTNIKKLAPGSWLEIDLQGQTTKGVYWDLCEKARFLRRNRIALSDGEALSELERLMNNAVSGQMMADVPLGAFLSGGVDSSTIVAMMCHQGGSEVKTFSMGFDEPGYNEAEHAKAVADHLGTQHTEMYVTGQDARAAIPQLAKVYDEPFADSSQIPTLLVSQLARRHVKVVLSGDGGDELFAGYNRHLIAERAWEKVSRIPLPLRKGLSAGALSISPAKVDATALVFKKFFRGSVNQSNLGDKLHKLARTVLPAANAHEMYRSLVSHWDNPASIVIGAEEPVTRIDELNFAPELTIVERMCLLDQITYLPDDILTKVDRAAMSLGLETRVPMLDHRVVEFAWSLPMEQKFRNGTGKWLLRELLYKHVPKSLIERPKQGFAVPLEHWLRGPLREWAEDLLCPESLQKTGFLDAEQVRAKWCQHLSGQTNWQSQIWNVLMFQSWYFETHS